MGKKYVVTLSKYYFISATSFCKIKPEINFTPSTFLTLNLKHQLCTKSCAPKKKSETSIQKQ